MKIIYRISYSVIILAILLIAWGVYSCCYPHKVMTINSVEIITPEVARGEGVRYKLDYCKYKNIESTIKKYLADGIIVPYAITKSRASVGCREVIITEKIPKFVNPGEYTIQAFISYDINPLKTITIEYETNKFKITE